VVSYGNASDINESELLQYLTQDDETKIITAYIEGIKEGKKFLQALKEATAVKPVIVLKSGSTEAGARGALSHTGSLAGANIIWKTIFSQSGALRVFSPEELIDMMVSFSYPHPEGKRVAIIGFGGGLSVQAADEAEKAGLSVPPLPQRIKKRLGKLALAPGSIFRNPIDMVGNFPRPEEIGEIIQIVANWDEIDSLLLHLIFGVGGFGFEDLKLYPQVLQGILNMAKTLNKPVVFVLSSINSPLWQGDVFQAQQECLAAGFPVYPSVRRAAQAINGFTSCWRNSNSLQD
jgi:acyl-CoA synthetase (NDP forming)